LQPNDSVYPKTLQGYVAKITECNVCHTNVPVTANGGPHGIHTVGQSWVNSHGDYADGNKAACAYCHGADYKGTALSVAKVARKFNAGDYGSKSFPVGHQFNCYDCHNGPNPRPAFVLLAPPSGRFARPSTRDTPGKLIKIGFEDSLLHAP
jgi:hypothetical protein